MIYGESDIPKNECIKLVESFFDIIKDELVKGSDVKIFGVWKMVSQE